VMRVGGSMEGGGGRGMGARTCDEEGDAPDAEHQVEVDGDPDTQRVRDRLDRVDLPAGLGLGLGLDLGRAR
jgi:hypothetical protein